MIVIDAHLDLAWNAVSWNRDLRLAVSEIRASEQGMDGPGRGRNTVSFDALRRGEVAVCLATVLARANPKGKGAFLDYRNQEIAYAVAQGQLSYYRICEGLKYLRMITDWPSLHAHVEAWEATQGKNLPLGFILSMEGADPIVFPRQAEDWWQHGLRVVGLAHYGPSAYAVGTGDTGGLTSKGRDLLRVLNSLGMILDATHLSDQSFWEALEIFKGPVLASHNNCRALVPGDRQFSDEQIRELIRRDAVIGAAFDCWMLSPTWVAKKSSPSEVGLRHVVDHIDHVCQLAGNSLHAAIGSDLDGGFGREQSPGDLDTIADLQRLPQLLGERGYRDSDVEAILHGNWLRFFKNAWKG
ncbi:MAG: membrane dipeptidase [Acidobacteriota bacterium]